jgi:hypothetical protein
MGNKSRLGEIGRPKCWGGNSVYSVKEAGGEKFYVRTGASTTELSPSQTQDFIKRRFA